jgi:hypothetical protein
MATESTGPWAFTDPRRDWTAIPYTDDDSIAVVDKAIETLVLLRAPMSLGDAGATISVLVSLAAEVDSRLPDAVADARDHDYSWDDIAMRLATTVATARRRYADYARWRKEHPLDLD